MKRLEIGDRVYWHDFPATITAIAEANGFDFKITFDEQNSRAWIECGKWHRYVDTCELQSGPRASGLYAVVQKHDNGFLRATRKPDTAYTLDTATAAAKEYAKDGNEYLVLKAVVSVKIPQAEPVVTTL